MERLAWATEVRPQPPFMPEESEVDALVMPWAACKTERAAMRPIKEAGALTQ